MLVRDVRIQVHDTCTVTSLVVDAGDRRVFVTATRVHTPGPKPWQRHRVHLMVVGPGLRFTREFLDPDPETDPCTADWVRALLSHLPT